MKDDRKQDEVNRTSRDVYNDMSPERKRFIDNLCSDLDKKIAERNEIRDKRKAQVPFDHDDWRMGDRRKHKRSED